jgi:hypothetical protein
MSNKSASLYRSPLHQHVSTDSNGCIIDRALNTDHHAQLGVSVHAFCCALSIR